MRRDYVSWALALAAGLLLCVGIAWAFTPQELMGERVISPPECKDGKCTLMSPGFSSALGGRLG